MANKLQCKTDVLVSPKKVPRRDFMGRAEAVLRRAIGYTVIAASIDAFSQPRIFRTTASHVF